MCGIYGIVGFNDKRLLKNMGDVIKHRGPDDQGFFIDNNVSMGNNRLSIIDLKTGKQPIHNEDESVWVVFNGEIYNYKELIDSLQKKGHRFYTNTDTEVIVHAYEEYGDECVKHFNGMFAFAIWDTNKKRIFLARDRLGEKPLYYTLFNESLLFASEIKSILQYEEIKREVNHNSLFNYFTFRYIPSSETLLKGIFELPPAHFMVYENKKIRIDKYWDLNPICSEKYSEDYCVTNLLELLKDSVKIRLMSDVPLGVCLSGGLDSSVIVALMSELVEEPIKTFTIGFGEKEQVNESKYARVVSEHFGTEHHALNVNADAVSLLPKTIWHLDNPISDPTTLAQYLVSELSKKHVSVVLTGEGADELFGGYPQYKIMMAAEKYRPFIPGFVKTKVLPRVINSIPNQILDRFFSYSSSLGEKGKERFSEYMRSLDNKERSYLLLESIFDEQERKTLFKGELANKDLKQLEEDVKPFLQNVNNKTYLNHLILLDIKRRLPYYLLHKVDKMSMAHALEMRVPFLDPRLVEFSFKIPSSLKIKNKTGKYILKKAMINKLPKEIINRKKQPFLVPLMTWYENGIEDLAQQVFSESEVCKEKYFHYSAIQNIFRNYKKSKFYYARQVWALLTFMIWHKLYIESDNLHTPKLGIT